MCTYAKRVLYSLITFQRKSIIRREWSENKARCSVKKVFFMSFTFGKCLKVKRPATSKWWLRWFASNYEIITTVDILWTNTRYPILWRVCVLQYDDDLNERNLMYTQQVLNGTNLDAYFIHRNSAEPPKEYGVLEIAVLIAGPIFVICTLVVMCFFYLWQKKNRNPKWSNPQKDPLIGKPEMEVSGPCLKELMEMTTSGSGSGNKLLPLGYTKNKRLHIIAFCRAILPKNICLRKIFIKYQNQATIQEVSFITFTASSEFYIGLPSERTIIGKQILKKILSVHETSTHPSMILGKDYSVI